MLLDFGELVLERPEILVGLEFGIILGNRHQPAEHGAEGVVGLGRGLDAPRFGRIGAVGGDLGQDLSLVGGIAFDNADQIRHQIGPAAELDGDPAEPLFGERAQAHEAIVDDDGVEKGQREQAERDP